jgi:hypothetical protein
MYENPLDTMKKLEQLAAWHRITAEYAGADWVWEARLRTAEDLERRAAAIRKQLPDDRDTAENDRKGIHEKRARRHAAGRHSANPTPTLPSAARGGGQGGGPDI